MPISSPSALITEEGRRVSLRLRGRVYDLTQDDLRARLGLPSGPPGLGITIEGQQMTFEFAADDQTVTVTAGQLQRRLAKKLAGKTSG